MEKKLLFDRHLVPQIDEKTVICNERILCVDCGKCEGENDMEMSLGIRGKRMIN